MFDNSYNGWTNYETWCVHLWLTNDETLYHLAGALVSRERDDQDAATMLKAEVDQIVVSDQEGLLPGLVRDLLTAALDRVDWIAIVMALRDF